MSRKSKIRVGVIDFGAGNLKSVANAILHLEAIPVVSNSTTELASCDSLILPGVGAFKHGIEAIKEANLFSFLQDVPNTGKKLLGICLGMQMLTEASSEFGETEGLGILPGRVDPLGSNPTSRSFRLPNVGWLTLERTGRHVSPLCDSVLAEIKPDTRFYFIHSYAVTTAASASAASSRYEGQCFSSVISADNILGVQFHPEKSGKAGLKMLNNFITGGA